MKEVTEIRISLTLDELRRLGSWHTAACEKETPKPDDIALYNDIQQIIKDNR